jgi:phage FluMu gp28-like protein
MVEPGALVLLLSPTQRQSSEIFRKATDAYRAMGSPVETARSTILTVEFANGSRIVALPDSEATIRGYSGVKLLIVDEAARVADSLYFAIRPMLAVSRGRLVALSTAFGKRGWFYSEWSGDGQWQRFRVTADECPRISKEFLAAEKRAIGERWYRQEYCCSYEDAIDAVFSQRDIDNALMNDEQPLTLEFEE